MNSDQMNKNTTWVAVALFGIPGLLFFTLILPFIMTVYGVRSNAVLVEVVTPICIVWILLMLFLGFLGSKRAQKK